MESIQPGAGKMKQIYLWGAGYWADYVYEKIKGKNYRVLGVIDNDVIKQNQEWKHGLMIYPPSYLSTSEFDYVVISPKQYSYIEKQCMEMDIPQEKIFSYWKDEKYGGILENRSEQIYSLEEDNCNLLRRLENAPYEYGLGKQPLMKSGEQLLNYILEKKASLSRYGDGEFELMLERPRPWFQNTNKNLADRLREIILTDVSEGIIIAIADNFGSLDKYTEDSADGIRKYLTRAVREDIMEFIDLKRDYYDAYVTRPYLIYRDKKNAIKIFDLFRRIWQNRNVILVEGRYARIGVGNDLFSNASTVKRILCPYKNAWGKYDEIMRAVRSVASKEDLICISLGPTATVMSYDLHKEGFQALDIGQIDTEYEWFLRKAKNRIAIPGKMVAEVRGDYVNNVLTDRTYYMQIVGEIDG